MRTQLIAVQSSLAWWGKMQARPLSLSLSLSPLSLSPLSLSLSLCWKKKKKMEALLRWWGCDLPLFPTSLPAGVHRLSINQRLLTAETTLSHQHAISWVTDSTLTTLHPQFKESCSPLRLLLALTSALSTPACPPHLELLSSPDPSGQGEDENKSWRNHKISLSAKRSRRERAISGLGREKCFQKQPSQEFQWWKLMPKMVGLSMLASITTTKPCSPADMPVPFKQASHSLQDSGRVGMVHAWWGLQAL